MNTQQSSIDELVLESQKGHTQAFGEIYDLYFQQIHKYVYYKVSKEHVDDIVASIFVKAWTKIKKYRKRSCPFSSWLFRIASNTVIDHYRTNKQSCKLEERIADENQMMNPETVLEKNLNGKRVHRALKEIGGKYQEVILLRFMNDMSSKQVAEIMKTNENHVRTLQHRALKKLRTVIEKHEQEAILAMKQDVIKKPVGVFRRIFIRTQ